MEKKTFAFKLADESSKATRKWKARDGVAIAGCSLVDPRGQYKASFHIGDDWYFC